MSPSERSFWQSVWPIVSLSPVLCCFVLTSGCDMVEGPTPLEDVPVWFPSLPMPDDNPLTADRVALGRKLFYEPLLSRDSSVSCATCHVQALAFSDGLPVSRGVEGRVTLRNAPSLANVAYVPKLNRDGGIPTLELQAQAPIFAHEEMDFTIAEFLGRISSDPLYQRMFRDAYGREPDAYGISRALAAFQRGIISGASRFDRFEYQGVADALSIAEQRGRELFLSDRTDCGSCHVPPLFTTHAFENIGLYTAYADSGRARITHLPADNGRFRVPSLRNVALTGPYMHDGSMTALREVVEHFNRGGVGHANQSALVRPLNLTSQEVDDLVAFLHTLTDTELITAPQFARPE